MVWGGCRFGFDESARVRCPVPKWTEQVACGNRWHSAGKIPAGMCIVEVGSGSFAVVRLRKKAVAGSGSYTFD
ncbi:MAG: hypothetical protein BHV63_03280 [Alistipes sp. 56_11]|nr:MAG: hypothetical protein BHV63_03280 [Alistipes sp. 56_11]